MFPQQKALIIPKKRGNLEVRSRSIPSPGTGQLLVKIPSATALNPELREGVETFRKGDKVLDILAHGNISVIDQGAFQQYALTVVTFTANIPPNQSFDSAATVPLGLYTAVAGLYGSHLGAGIDPTWVKCACNHEPKKQIVILGGSSVGSYTIRLARLSGIYPIELQRNHFFDRHLSGNQLVAAISKVIDSPIRIVFDAISLPETKSVGWRLLARNGVLGCKAVHTNGNLHPSDNHKLFCNSWAMVEKWLSEGIIQPNNHEVLPNGLEGIIGGLERMGMGQVSGTKCSFDSLSV
ncbi:hypothetical protein BD769DRAFT_1654247 [Suillus cothurnatus]|nr:hypothetical protein BD769DRAFT_1654247 [Suillus cothurnatus]